MKYTAEDIKYWEGHTASLEKGTPLEPYFIPERPDVPYNFFHRLKLAFLVLIGKYDTLDWEEN